MARFNPSDEASVARLHDAIDFSRQRLRPFRENRQDMIKAYAGDSYGENSDTSETVVNMMELAVNVYQRALASRTPQVMVDSESSSLTAIAEELTLLVNYVIDKELQLGKSLNKSVYDALFGPGIIKVGVAPRESSEILGHLHDSGEIFADVVDFVDWVHDANATELEQVDFCGNRYRLPLDMVMESPLFSDKAKKRLAPLQRQDESTFANDDDENPASLSRGNTPMAVEYSDRVALWDIWLPREKLVVTMTADNSNTVLRVVEWDGPERGPYHFLGFGHVPSNILPLAPAMVWENLNDLVNRLSFKAAQQADRQKNVLAAQNQAQSTMEAIIDTPDGMGITTDVDPNMIKEFRFGGIDGNLMQSLMAFKDMFSYVAGNLDALGGLGAQTRTIGQDKLLAEGASQRINDMQDQVKEFATGIVEDIAWYLWNDPLAEYSLKKKISDEIEIDFVWNADSRSGGFFDYNFNVVPHSLQAQTPKERLNFIMSITSQVILPMMPILQQQGLAFDMEEFLRAVSRLSDSPDLERFIYKATGGNLNDGPAETRQSPNTTRTYVREQGGNGQQGGGQGPQQAQQFQTTEQPGGAPSQQPVGV